jgi:hypothetical protein
MGGESPLILWLIIPAGHSFRQPLTEHSLVPDHTMKFGIFETKHEADRTNPANNMVCGIDWAMIAICRMVS